MQESLMWAIITVINIMRKFQNLFSTVLKITIMRTLKLPVMNIYLILESLLETKFLIKCNYLIRYFGMVPFPSTKRTFWLAPQIRSLFRDFWTWELELKLMTTLLWLSSTVLRLRLLWDTHWWDWKQTSKKLRKPWRKPL
jgi:hypothetical protein